MEKDLFVLRLFCAALITLLTFFMVLWRAAKEDLNYSQSAYRRLDLTLRKILDEAKSGLIMPRTIIEAEEVIQSLDGETPISS